MDVKITLNGKIITDSVDTDMVLLDFCRKHNCYSVKRGCESGNCGLCTVLLDGKPILSCSTPVGRANGRRVDRHLPDFLQHREQINVVFVIRDIL